MGMVMKYKMDKKSCPCGNTHPLIVQYNSFLKREFKVHCFDCGRSTKLHFSKRKALEDWNNYNFPKSFAKEFIKLTGHSEERE